MVMTVPRLGRGWRSGVRVICGLTAHGLVQNGHGPGAADRTGPGTRDQANVFLDLIDEFQSNR